MWLINEIRAMFTPPTLEQAFASNDVPCFLPSPVKPKPVERTKRETPKQQNDAYLHDKETNTWAFRNDSTAGVLNNDKDGAVPTLTANDKAVLESQKLWGSERTATGKVNKSGVEANEANAKAKRVWYDGGGAAEIAKATGKSESWGEKRHAAFCAALALDMGDN